VRKERELLLARQFAGAKIGNDSFAPHRKPEYLTSKEGIFDWRERRSVTIRSRLNRKPLHLTLNRKPLHLYILFIGINYTLKLTRLGGAGADVCASEDR